MKPILIGCPFDNGIQMMLRFRRGITGAADGPQAVLDQLQPHLGQAVPSVMLPLRKYNLSTKADNVDDPAFIKRQHTLTEIAHNEITAQIQQMCAQGFRPVAIGGDHSLTYPLCRGVGLAHPGKNFGVIYIDAHLDMRPLETYQGISGLISSGNSFRRLLAESQVAGHNMAAIGIHRSTSEIFGQMTAFAAGHGVTIIYDDECRQPQAVVQRVFEAVQSGTDGLYVSVDIDTIEAQVAPGVSAPAEQGLPVDFVWRLVEEIAKTQNVWGFDVVEVSSRQRAWFELYGQKFTEPVQERQRKLKKTARLAAELIQCFLQTIL